MQKKVANDGYFILILYFCKINRYYLLNLVDMAYEVTIGIPVYNVEKYIVQTIESVLNQTFESIEFLFCDDCGTDGSMGIVKHYQQTHVRGKDIHIVKQPRNMGSGEARNRMLTVAQGKFIYFMDSDDTIALNTIELLYNKAQYYDADIVYGSMRKVLLYDNNKEILIQLPSRVFLKEGEFAEYAFAKYDAIPASTCNFLVKLDVYNNNDLHYQSINYWDDFTFTFDLPAYVTRVVLLPDLTYNYLCHFASLSNYAQRDHIAKQEILTTMRALDILKERSYLFVNMTFFPQRMLKLMKTCFFVVSTILRNEKIISPSFSNQELRDFMIYPISLSKVCSFRQMRLQHFSFYLLGLMPPSLSLLFMKLLAKRKGLI